MRGLGTDIEHIKKKWIDDYDDLLCVLLEKNCFDFEKSCEEFNQKAKEILVKLNINFHDF